MDSSTFSPNSLSLIQLFKASEIYAVPEYQRPYSWGQEEVDKLWEDILEAYQNRTEETVNPYFLGSIIVIDKGNGVNDIVDGQQRMTTLTILFDVLNKMNPQLNKDKDASENPLLINNRKLSNCICNDNDNCRLRLQSKATYCSDFESAIIDKEDYQDYKPLRKNNLDAPKNRFINTAAIFKEFIEAFKKAGQDVGDFVNYICNNVFVIKITCKNVSFAIKLFQVLNNRGLDLSPADVIKGYLMDVSKLPQKDELRFITDWNEVEKKVAGMENEDLSSQFTYYLYYLLGRSPKRTLVEEFEDIIKGKNLDLGEREKSETKNSVSLMKNLKDFVDKYDEIDDSTNEVITTFFYLPWKTFWATCLITAKHLNYEKFDDYAKILRRFFYISYICGYSLNQLKKPLLDIINTVKKHESIERVSEICNNTLNEKEYESRLKLNLSQKNIYGEAWLRPVLLLINNHYDDSPVAVKIPMDSHLHVEHILPKEFNIPNGWSHIDKEEGLEFINSLGNLTLLGYKKNIKASNFSYERKSNIYSGKDDSGKWTCYNVTRKVQDFVVNDKWTIISIKNRAEHILNMVGEILDIEFMKKNNK